jgi:hypothetical protein
MNARIREGHAPAVLISLDAGDELVSEAGSMMFISGDVAMDVDELGQKAFELAESGAISHAELDPIVERIRGLKAQEDGAGGATTASSGSTTPPPSDVPPAMPT